MEFRVWMFVLNAQISKFSTSRHLMNLNFFGRSQRAEVGSTVLDPYAEATLAVVQDRVAESAGIYIKTIRYVVLVAVFVLPLFFLPLSTNALEANKQLLLVAMAGTGLILWLLSVVSSGRLAWKNNLIDKGVLAFVGAITVATIFSVSPLKSLFGMSVSLSNSLISITALAVLYYLVVNLFDDGGKSIRNTIVLSSTIALVYGLLQMLNIHVLETALGNSRAFNTVGSINTLGILAAMLLPLFAKSDSQNTFWKGVYTIGFLVGLGILVILNWWVIWTIAIAGMVALIGFENLRHEKFKLSRFVLPMTVIVIAVFLMVVNFNISALKSNFPVEVAPSHGLSSDVAKEVLKENIIVGYGPENFSLAFDRYGAGRLANTTLSNIRFFDGTSEFMTWIVHGGILAGVAILFLLVCYIWGIFKKRNAIREDQSGVTMAVLSSATAAFVAMFIYPFNLTLSLVFFTLLALSTSVLWRSTPQVRNIEDKAWLSLTASLGFISGLILVLVGAYFTLSNYISDVRYAKAFSASTSQQAVDTLTEAINWNQNDDRYFRALSQLELNLLSSELSKKADPKDDQRQNRIQTHLSNAIQFARQATTVSPRESSNWSNLGSVYQSLVGLVDGVDKLAEDSYLKAESLRPNDASLFNSIGSVYLSKANFSLQMAQSGGEAANKYRQDAATTLAQSEAAFRKAIEISNNYGIAIYNLGVVYEREGKLDEAIKQLEKVAPFNSDQPSLAFELGLLYYRAGQKDKSFAQFQRAVVLSPDFANARWYLSLIYEERKDYPSAIEQLEKILSVETNKDNETVKQKLAQLQSGQPLQPGQKVIDQRPIQ